MITLTAEERLKFAAWCKQEAASNNAIVEQMVKLGGATMEQLAKVKKAQSAAMVFVARELESIETQTITG